jgi:hypothetical protein
LADWCSSGAPPVLLRGFVFLLKHAGSVPK